MQILKEENAQGSAELLLIFGGVIVIAIALGVVYQNYVTGLGEEISANDTQSVNNNLTALKNKFK